MAPVIPHATMIVLKSASNWWDDVNNSPLWQDRIFHVLAVTYGVIGFVALVCGSIYRTFNQFRVLFVLC